MTHGAPPPERDLTSRFVRADMAEGAEVFVGPSREALLLVRAAGWLVAPEHGQGGLAGRALRFIVIAPFTQLTFFSFDLQLFLFMVLHRRFAARAGHLLFMLAVNLLVMAALASHADGPITHTTPTGAMVYAALLLVWYGAMAATTGLWLWFAAVAPVVIGLHAGAIALLSATHLSTAQLWALVPAAAFGVAFSHTPEPLQPPRAFDPDRWVRWSDAVFGPPGHRHRVTVVLARVGRSLVQAVTGTLNELWASPRLLPYNILMLLFAVGYRPDVYRRARSFADRALESGNPALDFVGIGGGAFLRRPGADEL